MAKVVAFTGSKGAGKDTCANYLASKTTSIKMSFADALKDVLASVFNWSRETLQGETPEARLTRDATDVFWSSFFNKEYNMRMAMTDVGTMFRTYIHPDIWVTSVRRKIESVINSYQTIIISDARYANELNMARAFNAYIIEVQPAVLPEYYNDAILLNTGKMLESDFVSKYPDIHDSEYKWIGINSPDAVIVNNGTIEELYAKLDNLSLSK